MLLLASATLAMARAVDPAIECSLAALPDGIDGGWLLGMLPGLPHGISRIERSAWAEKLKNARRACKKGFNASVYEREDLQWTQASFVTPQMHPYDRYFYCLVTALLV